MTDFPVVHRPDLNAALEPTLLDRVIGYFSPRAELRRRRTRAASYFAASMAMGGYEGGSRTRTALKSWTPGSGSPTSDLIPQLDMLRGRSRDLARNNPIAVGAINTNVTNVVGPGLRLRATPDRDFLNLSDEEAEAWERRAELLWSIWSQGKGCDITRQQSFAGMTDLAFRSTLESGDLLVVRRFSERRDDILGLAIQFVEADRVCNPNFMYDTPRLIAGVDLNQNGAPVAFNVLNRHPGDRLYYRLGTWSRIQATGRQSGMTQAFLLFHRTRPGQVRGVPYLAPVMEPLKQLDRYTEAEIMAAVVSAMFTVFIKAAEGDGELGLAPMDPDDTDTPDTEYKLGYGMMVDLAEGESIETADPKRPNASFDPFVTSILRQIGVALELPYEVLIKAFTNSYSAARAALLEAFKMFRTRRAWLAGDFCQPIYTWMLSEAVSRGLISAPGFLEDPAARFAWSQAEWIGPAPGQINPLDEIKAAEKRIALGVTTHTEETAQITGGDWESKHRQLARETRMRRDAGLLTEPAAEPAGATVVDSEGANE